MKAGWRGALKGGHRRYLWFMGDPAKHAGSPCVLLVGTGWSFSEALLTCYMFGGPLLVGFPLCLRQGVPRCRAPSLAVFGPLGFSPMTGASCEMNETIAIFVGISKI